MHVRGYQKHISARRFLKGVNSFWSLVNAHKYGMPQRPVAEKCPLECPLIEVAVPVPSRSLWDCKNIFHAAFICTWADCQHRFVVCQRTCLVFGKHASASCHERLVAAAHCICGPRGNHWRPIDAIRRANCVPFLLILQRLVFQPMCHIWKILFVPWMSIFRMRFLAY